MSIERKLFPCPPGYFIMAVFCPILLSCVFFGILLFYAKLGGIIENGIMKIFLESSSQLLVPILGRIVFLLCYWGLFLVFTLISRIMMEVIMKPTKMGQFRWVFPTYLFVAAIPVALYVIFIMLPRWLTDFNPQLISYICDKLSIGKDVREYLYFVILQYAILISGAYLAASGARKIIKRRCSRCGYVRSASTSYYVKDDSMQKETWGVIEGEDGKKYELNSYRYTGVESVFSHTTYECPQCDDWETEKEWVNSSIRKY